MWLNLSDDEQELIQHHLRSTTGDHPENPVAIALADRLLADRKGGENDDHYIAAAREAWDDEVDIDSDAVVSVSDDGATVMCWVYVDDDEAGLCRDCRSHYDDGGDGYNGRCPDCADVAEREGRADD